MKISLTSASASRSLFSIFNLVLKTREFLLTKEHRESLFGGCTIVSTDCQAHKEEEASPVNERERRSPSFELRLARVRVAREERTE